MRLCFYLASDGVYNTPSSIPSTTKFNKALRPNCARRYLIISIFMVGKPDVNIVFSVKQ